MSDIVTTSYLLHNLHCPSCVAAICSLLQKEYGHHVVRTSPDLVTSVVTVQHRDDPVVSVSRMQKTLEDAGFDVGGVRTSAVAADDLERSSLQLDPGESSHRAMNRSTSSLNSWFRFWRHRGDPVLESARAAHLANCEACRSDAIQPTALEKRDRDILSKIDSKSTISINTKYSTHGLQKVAVDSDAPSTWRATVSIGGMTCAVCTNTITEELEKIPWISKVVVNLVGNSASIDYTDESRAREIAEAIEDLGYDATIDTIINLNEAAISREAREVQIKVDGMFCSRCPERISTALQDLGRQRLEVIQEPTTQNPILKLCYTPDAPHFTIRQILRAIEATDPSIHASIHHPPSLEERSKAIRIKHQRSLIKRVILTTIISIPSFILGIVYMTLLPDSNKERMHLMEPWVSGISRLDLALFILATPVYFFAADVFHLRAIKEIVVMWRPGSRVPLFRRFWKFGSMSMLISLGTSIAYFSSIGQMIAMAVRNNNHHQDSGAEMYWDSVVFLTLFLLAGKLIESYSKSKAGDAVEMLGKLRPSTALLVEDNVGAQETTTVPVDQLEFGDIIRVPHGASPAADGIVTAGEATFDESSLTGESRPIKKREGDQVFAGTVNQASAITIRVTGTSGKSMLDQIVEVVREGQTKRAPIEQIADLLTTYFVPIIILIGVLTWIVWMTLGASGVIPEKETRAAGGWVAFSLQFAIAVFVVACPCGLGLAAPTAIFVGGGIAAKHGILVKGGGEAFEKASKIDCVVFDKTGTLTEGGNPQVTDSAIFPDQSSTTECQQERLLSVVKAVEENSSHPIAKAVVNFCGATRSAEIQGLEELPGKGMKASYIVTTDTINTKVDNQSFDILIGNEALMPNTMEISPKMSGLLAKWKSEAKSVALIATKPTIGESWILAAALSISDPIREEAKAVIGALTSRGTQVWMLSGDNETTARAVAELVGISADNVIAEVLPSDKAARISALQASLHASLHTGDSRRAMVAMVGDGINDAPALTTADVGIAIGSGSDVAISSAAFVLATSRLAAVVTLLDLSSVVFRRIRANFAWAIIYNMIAVPVAAGCFWAVTTSSGEHVKLDPVWAALAMALSSISVVLSSLSLRTRIPGVGFRYNKSI